MHRLNCFQEHSDGTCTDESETIWGSLNPVISLSRQRIYRNQKCALCNDVDDFVPLDKIMICDATSFGGVRSFDGLFIEVRSNFNSSLCKIQFFLPEGARNVDQRLVKCFPDLSLNYRLGDLTVTDNRKDICKNGAVMPFLSASWYRNFYCTSLEKPHFPCPEPPDIFKTSTPAKGFPRSMVVLIGNLFSSAGQPDVATLDYKEACTNINGTTVS